MRHRILAVLLGIGALAGFACGFHSIRHHGGGPWHRGRHAGFEAHVAEVCTRAAEQVYRERGSGGTRTPP